MCSQPYYVPEDDQHAGRPGVREWRRGGCWGAINPSSLCRSGPDGGWVELFCFAFSTEHGPNHVRYWRVWQGRFGGLHRAAGHSLGQTVHFRHVWAVKAESTTSHVPAEVTKTPAPFRARKPRALPPHMHSRSARRSPSERRGPGGQGSGTCAIRRAEACLQRAPRGIFCALLLRTAAHEPPACHPSRTPSPRSHPPRAPPPMHAGLTPRTPHPLLARGT